MVELFRANVVFAALTICVITAFGIAGVPRTVGVLLPLIFFMLLAWSRIVGRYILFDLLGQNDFGGETKRVLIYGAGNAGQQLALSVKHYPHHVILEL